MTLLRYRVEPVGGIGLIADRADAGRDPRLLAGDAHRAFVEVDAFCGPAALRHAGGELALPAADVEQPAGRAVAQIALL